MDTDATTFARCADNDIALFYRYNFGDASRLCVYRNGAQPVPRASMDR